MESPTLEFDERGLVPVVVQDHESGRVLMLAYLNREALAKTLETQEAYFWSRTRGELWRKGETSGNTMRVVSVGVDCDADAILFTVEPRGPACHTGEVSCFFTGLSGVPRAEAAVLTPALEALAHVIHERASTRASDSYTAQLLEGGLDRILKKVGEEATEVVIAGKNEDSAELTRESADLLYHLLVLWEAAGVSLSAVAVELERRAHPRGSQHD